MSFWKKIVPMAALLLLLSSCGEKNFTVGILARGEGGAVITGDTLQQIPYGTDASFGVTLPAGEAVVQVFVDDVLTEDYTFADGVLTLPDCTSPATVRVVSGLENQKAYWEADALSSAGGTFTSNVPQGPVNVGSMITLTALPKEGAVFLGWSERFALKSGGTLLSEEEQITVEIGDDYSFFIANYDVSAMPKTEEKKTVSSPAVRGPNTYTIYYHINGGNLLAEDKVAVETTFDTTYWSMPVAREDDGTFQKDGYVLLGYSTDPAGGELIRPGYKFRLPSGDKIQNLYCVWQKETDPAQFRITENDDKSLRIDLYTGSDPVVYIPRTIDGKRVKQIAPGAFTGNTALTEVYIPSTVTAVDDGAFMDCPSLTTITVFDNLQKVSSASFEGSPVETMRLCAATTPRYVDSYINFGIKFERLMLGEGGPRIVVVAGSSKYWGLDSLLMESLVEDGYTVVNYGTSVGMNILFYLEAVTPWLTENDILLYAPEQYGVNAHHSTGNPELPGATFQGFASSYNLLEGINLTHFENVFDAFAEFVTGRLQMSATTWDACSPLIDRTGAYTRARSDYNLENYYGGTLGYFRFDSEAFPAEYLPNLNRALDRAAETGATVLFSYPPHNKNAVMPEYLNDEALEAYMDFIDENIHAARISDIRNYIHEGKYFDDSDYHLGVEGRGIHTRQLTEDLIASGAVKGK